MEIVKSMYRYLNFFWIKIIIPSVFTKQLFKSHDITNRCYRYNMVSLIIYNLTILLSMNDISVLINSCDFFPRINSRSLAYIKPSSTIHNEAGSKFQHVSRYKYYIYKYIQTYYYISILIHYRYIDVYIYLYIYI